MNYDLLLSDLKTMFNIQNIEQYVMLKDLVEKTEVAIKQAALEKCEEQHLKGFKEGVVKVAYVPESVCKSFSSSSLKEHEPNVYNLYLKDQIRKASIRVTYNQEGSDYEIYA